MTETLRGTRSHPYRTAAKTLLVACSCTLAAALGISWTAVQQNRASRLAELETRLEGDLIRAENAVAAWQRNRDANQPLEPGESAELRALLDRERGAHTRLLLVSTGGAVLAAATDPGEPAPERVPPDALHGTGVDEYAGVDGTRMLASSRALAGSWQLVAEERADRAFAPLVALTASILAIDGALVVLFGLLVYRITTPHRLDTHEAANRRLMQRNAELQQAKETFEQLSITDGLTRLHNHRFFQDHLTREIKRAIRTGTPLSMLLIDIDDFKGLNDRFGHAAGDEILRELARIMSNAVRETDLLARYGGEEFVVLAADTNIAGGYQLAEKLRLFVAETSFDLDPSRPAARITVSIGVAAYRGSRTAFFRDADGALYQAKGGGKNCVFVDGEHDLA